MTKNTMANKLPRELIQKMEILTPEELLEKINRS